jgi:hypothetical protein
MRTTMRLRAGLAIAGLICAAGCGIVGPGCLEQQKSGAVVTVSGRIDAGQVASHLVPYDTRGSQNNVGLSFVGQGSVTGPRITFYATDARCVDFVPPVGDTGFTQGICTPIERPGGYLGPDGALVPTSMILGGPGNGSPAGFHEYKIFVVGDPQQATSYTISVTWFSGPDC